MKLFKQLGIATTVAALLATGAIAQDDAGSAGQMINNESGMNGNMMNGDAPGMEGMGGMMPMMKMMQQMGPMMKACTEMMQAMTEGVNEAPPSEEEG